jgi:phytoene desaturase
MSKDSSTKDYDAVVIGAGIGGLACGATLAKGGKRVKVIEQHTSPGGYCVSFDRKGFKFSAGVLRINGCEPGGIIYELLSTLGLQNEVEFYRLDPLMRVVFPGESFAFPFKDMPLYIAKLLEKFPEEKRGITQLLDTMKALFTEKLSSPGPALKKYRDKTFKELLDEYITNEKLKSFISFLSLTDAAVSPSRGSAVFCSRLIMAHFTEGGFWPKGGPQALADAIAKGLQSFGGELEFRTKATKIIIKDGKAVGVETEDGRRIQASYIISNAAARQSYFDLVGEDKLEPDFVAKLKQMEVGPSIFEVYLGVDLDPRTVGITDFELDVFETFDLDKGFDIICGGELPPFPSPLVVATPTLLDPSIAPENKHIVTLLTYAPYHLKGKNWKKEKARVTEELINRAEKVIPGLSQHIIVKDSATPLTMERYTLNTDGSIVGWANTPGGFWDKPPRESPIANLYLTGHWTRPGGGVSSVLLSGMKVAQSLLKG